MLRLVLIIFSIIDGNKLWQNLTFCVRPFFFICWIMLHLGEFQSAAIGGLNKKCAKSSNFYKCHFC